MGAQAFAARHARSEAEDRPSRPNRRKFHADFGLCPRC